MKTLKIGALIVGLCLAMSSCLTVNLGKNCESKNTVSGVKEIGQFSKIKVRSGKVEYIPADYNKIEYTVCDDAVDKLEIEVKNSQLSIGINDSKNNHTLDVVVYGNIPLVYVDASGATEFVCEKEIVTKSLTVDCSGASEFKLLGKITAMKFDADCSGASDLSIRDIECTKLSIDCSGASSAYLKGLTLDADYDASGASDIEASDMIAVNVNAEASGASDIKCFASESGSLKKSSSGASSIKIKR